jgi:hypothetical protein
MSKPIRRGFWLHERAVSEDYIVCLCEGIVLLFSVGAFDPHCKKCGLRELGLIHGYGVLQALCFDVFGGYTKCAQFRGE